MSSGSYEKKKYLTHLRRRTVVISISPGSRSRRSTRGAMNELQSKGKKKSNSPKEDTVVDISKTRDRGPEIQ